MEMLKQLPEIESQESCKPVKTPPLEDILVEIKPTRRSRLDTGGKE